VKDVEERRGHEFKLFFAKSMIILSSGEGDLQLKWVRYGMGYHTG